jgi:hypothetical protein
VLAVSYVQVQEPVSEHDEARALALLVLSLARLLVLALAQALAVALCASLVLAHASVYAQQASSVLLEPSLEQALVLASQNASEVEAQHDVQ